MYNNTNPAEIYPNTTWELLSSDKYIKTGNTPLSTGGNNTVSITKANLPNIKLKVDNFLLNYGNSYTSAFIHSGSWAKENTITNTENGTSPKAKYTGGDSGVGYALKWTNTLANKNTGTASPNTEALGSGTPLNIQPAYITLKFWKRLS